MPNRDGTGPMGKGSRTGWGAGTCNGEPLRGQGRGLGFGFGRGGRGRGFGGLGLRRSATSPEQRRSWLESRIRDLQDAVNLLDKE